MASYRVSNFSLRGGDFAAMERAQDFIDIVHAFRTDLD
jgi:hypothetical protein